MDLKCLFLTVLAVLRRDGVQEGAEKKVNDTPLVSVIMATYRREQELSCALESHGRTRRLFLWMTMRIRNGMPE